jgi:hypothetical protein
LVGVNTHWTGAGTLPCEGPNLCKYCQDGHSYRWHGYLSAILTDTLEHIIFEMTAAAAETFFNYLHLNSTLRGCHFQAKRASKQPNSRVIIACKRIDEQRIRLPDPPNIKAILCHIWNVPYQPDPRDSLTNRLKEILKTPDNNGQDLHPTPTREA